MGLKRAGCTLLRSIYPFHFLTLGHLAPRARPEQPVAEGTSQVRQQSRVALLLVQNSVYNARIMAVELLPLYSRNLLNFHLEIVGIDATQREANLISYP